MPALHIVVRLDVPLVNTRLQETTAPGSTWNEHSPPEEVADH